MKKIKPFLSFTLLIICLELLALIVIISPSLFIPNAYYSNRVTFALGLIWAGGMVCLCIKKGKLKKALSRLLNISTILATCVVLVFVLIFVLIRCHPYGGSFSTTTSLFQGKNVLILIPHQDDDINLAGGLIEQYVEGGSDVTVAFATNGDRYLDAEIRAAEALNVLTTLGVKKENILYLGFGDQWVPQTQEGMEIGHIYNSQDPDAVWTSLHGATKTYGTESIGCYLELPYTRNNYVHSIQSLIQEKKPDTIFAVDFDSHADHKSTSLFFEEAMCRILTLDPDYHPTVYKGFAYGTAWRAAPDYYNSINSLSTIRPDEDVWSLSAYGYNWENRDRFPMSETNLNWVLINNSVYRSLNQYRTQDAYPRTDRILNNDKVFWERRTDSLLYGAEIFADEQKTELLNDFKLAEFENISEDGSPNSGFVPLQDKTVTVKPETPIVINSICLYDNPDASANILAGYVDFSDGSRIEFSELNKDGSGTTLSFPEKSISWMEIVVTEADSEAAGLSEIEAFYDASAPQVTTDTFLMAVDQDDNFVYDYLLHGSSSVELTIKRFPETAVLTEEDISLSFETSGNGASCHWEEDALVVTCQKGSKCVITVSDGVTSTTFTVFHPSDAEYGYMQLMRAADKAYLNARALYTVYKSWITLMIQS